jgi:hypothetical protein
MEDGFIERRWSWAFWEAMGILGCFGSPEVGVCIRNVESMNGLFRIFGISDIEIVFLLQPNDVSSS